MPNKTKTYSKEDLLLYRLTDAKERQIRLSDTVDVACLGCDSVYSVKMTYIKNALKHRGKNWECESCIINKRKENGKKNKGDMNPFYGKRHSKATKEKMKKSASVRWETINEDTRKNIGQEIRNSFAEKYGESNPMMVEDIRKKHRTVVAEKNKDNDFKDKKRERFKETCLSKYGVDHPFKEKEMFENWRKAILSADSYEKAKQTIKEKYGNEVFFNTEHFIELKKTSDWSVSKPEKEIRDWISSLGFIPKKHHTGKFEIDIFIEEKMVGIEYHGLYFHREDNVGKKLHVNKYLDAKDNNIQLLQIFGHEWKTKKEQIKSRLKSILGINEKIGARKCEIREASKEDAKLFNDKYHIQGNCSSTLRVGLYYRDELVALSCFGEHHRKKDTMVMKRFCGKDGVSVAGGLSKIMKYASGVIEKDIISWCDLRWSNGEGYLKSGWIIDEIIDPDYFYFSSGENYVSKQSRRKSAVNTPVNMTEKEHAALDGLYRVWDCGKIRFVYKR